jgi:hypothetical protein
MVPRKKKHQFQLNTYSAKLVSTEEPALSTDWQKNLLRTLPQLFFLKELLHFSIEILR